MLLISLMRLTPGFWMPEQRADILPKEDCTTD